MKLEDLKNIKEFLRRVPMNGPEAIGWVQTMAAVEAEITELTAPKQPDQPAQ